MTLHRNLSIHLRMLSCYGRLNPRVCDISYKWLNNYAGETVKRVWDLGYLAIVIGRVGTLETSVTVNWKN